MSIFPKETKYSQEQIDELLKSIQNFIKTSYTYNKDIKNSLIINLSSSFTFSVLLNNQISTYQKMFKKISQKINDNTFKIIKSIPGITDTQALIILAEINTISNFDSHKALANYSGFGNSKHYNPYLRNIFLSTTQNCIKHVPELYNYYHQKRPRTPLERKRLLIKTTRKFIRILYALLTKNMLYQSDSNSIYIEFDKQKQIFINTNNQIISLIKKQ